MAVNDVYYALVNHTLGLGQKVQWGVHYVETVSAGAGNHAEELAAGLASFLAVTGDYLDFIMDSTILDSVEVVQKTGGEEFFTEVVNELGNMTGQQLPPQTAPLISFYSDSIGRDQHARIYLPPPNEAANDAGMVENGFQASLQLFGEGLITQLGITTGEFQACIFHRENGTHDNIEFAVAREDFKTQRRRVVGVGI